MAKIWSNIEQSVEGEKTRNEKSIHKTPTKISQHDENTNHRHNNNNTKHSRVENYTNIRFTHDEIQLLNKGLKYTLHCTNKKWIET
jgi:hypothetical protein